MSKLGGIWIVRTYRDVYELFMSNVIFFNHESEVRGSEFVTKKITRFVGKNKKRKQRIHSSW